MRLSKMLAPTLREVPAEAEIISHQLMLRAGLIRKSASGIYTYLPLGMRVLEKIMTIVREEMDRFGGQEVLLPIIQPAELWQESGRWEVYGDEMFRLQDRHGRDFCLGPTHEEIITALVRMEVSSYKQLPLLLYQIQNKYRDEKRPRFGLMRGREFIMKDLYSFDRDAKGLKASYEKMYQAYSSVFRRCGTQFRVVEADSGAIGGSTTHEFMVLAESGEAEIVYCSHCSYAANVEKAEAIPRPEQSTPPQPMELVETPGAATIEEVSQFLAADKKKLIKTLFYQADDRLVAVLVRGDREVNTVKLQNQLQCLHLELAGREQIEGAAAAPAGYVGPIGLDITILADKEVPLISDGVVGANKENYHYIHVQPGRDFSIDQVSDLRLVEPGEPCPACEGELLSAQGIEVGQIFQLGTKYSDALGAKYTDENGREHPIVMGCYGIGVSRTAAAAIEQNHDEHGIIWPVTIAPAEVIVIPVSTRDEEQLQAAEQLYNTFLGAGLEVVLDDRDERAGVKFKDADLIGFPLRVTVGKRTVNEGTVDVTLRASGEEITIALDAALDQVINLLNQLYQQYQE